MCSWTLKMDIEAILIAALLFVVSLTVGTWWFRSRRVALVLALAAFFVGWPLAMFWQGWGALGTRR